MTRRLYCWVTDEDHQMLTEQAQLEGITAHEMMTVLAIGALRGKRVKKPGRWMKKYEELTRSQSFNSSGSMVDAKVRAILSDESPLSTRQINEKLGLKLSSSRLREVPRIEAVGTEKRPKGSGGRGRPATLWALSS